MIELFVTYLFFVFIRSFGKLCVQAVKKPFKIRKLYGGSLDLKVVPFSEMPKSSAQQFLDCEHIF